MVIYKQAQIDTFEVQGRNALPRFLEYQPVKPVGKKRHAPSKLASQLLYVRPSMSKVVSLQAVREMKEAETEDHAYHAQILGMDKVELLEEMVRFQEERSRVGHLTMQMMVRGKVLFKALEDHAETQELRILSRSYRRHLEHEMAAFIKPRH